MILAGVFLLFGLIASCFLGESRRLTALFIASVAVEPVRTRQGWQKTSRVPNPGIWITNDSFSAGRSQVSQPCVLHLLARSTQQYCQDH